MFIHGNNIIIHNSSQDYPIQRQPSSPVPLYFQALARTLIFFIPIFAFGLVYGA
jgi:hypothetical protein